MERQEIVNLFEDVPAYDPESDDDAHIVEETREIKQDGTIENVWLRNYIGHDFDLRYQVLIKHDKDERSLFHHLGKEFITGEDDTRNIELREEVQKGDELIVRAENVETDYLYHANASVTIDYQRGLMGLIEEIADSVPFIGGDE
ncbi:hypothetical protein [Halorussus halophilus]|uniref:hypothetical protein n=1 Tax=Halorussus halophilus TaxID=2650975 RepID=UPI001300DE9C|nr:hypothetical protein [Halorussus halophilus]